MAKLLELDTLTQRDHIRIDGASYEMRNVDELSLYEVHRLEQQGMRASELMERVDDLGENEDAEFDALTHSLIDLCIVDLPADVRTRLTQQQRFRIIEVFTQRSGAKAAPGRKAKAKKKASRKGNTTSESISRNSSGSTAATPSAG